MKTPQEIAEYLIDVIANIYKRPQMYAQTPSELSATLHDCHNMLDYVLDRQGASTSLHAKIWGKDLGSTIAQPSWWHELVSSPDSPHFETVIDKWRQVDLQIEMKTD